VGFKVGSFSHSSTHPTLAGLVGIIRFGNFGSIAYFYDLGTWMGAWDGIGYITIALGIFLES
jgi:hypothetical protein